MDISPSPLFLSGAKGDKLSWRALVSDALHLDHVIWPVLLQRDNLNQTRHRSQPLLGVLWDLGGQTLTLLQVLVGLCGAAEHKTWIIWLLPLKAGTAVPSEMREREKEPNAKVQWGYEVLRIFTWLQKASLWATHMCKLQKSGDSWAHGPVDSEVLRGRNDEEYR